MKRSHSRRKTDQRGTFLLVAIVALLVMVVVWTAKGDLSPKSFPGIERLRGEILPLPDSSLTDTRRSA